MKLLGSMVVVLVLLLPAPVHAQSVKLTDLVGTWKGGSVDSTGKITSEDSVTFRPDSTSNWAQSKTKTQNFRPIHRLKGDTLQPDAGSATYIAKLKDQQLDLSRVGKPDKIVWTFKRADTPTPKP